MFFCENALKAHLRPLALPRHIGNENTRPYCRFSSIILLGTLFHQIATYHVWSARKEMGAGVWKNPGMFILQLNTV